MNRYFKKIAGLIAAAAVAAGSIPGTVYAADILPEEEIITLEQEAEPPAADTEILPEYGSEGTANEETANEETADEETKIREGAPSETPAEQPSEAPEGKAQEKSLPASIGTANIGGSVRPDKTAITKISVGTKRITVKWDSLMGQVDGYQIQYSTAKDFSSGKKTVKVSGDQARSCVIKGLSSGKRYYVRMRGFKTTDGKKSYSKWSDVKSAKLTYNSFRISGSTEESRTIYLFNPKNKIKSLKAAVWTEANGQDDLVWYSMKKTSTGTWKVQIDLMNLLHDGAANIHLYANGNLFVGEKTFDAPPMGFPVCSSEEEYIERIAPAVQAACKKYGYLPSVLIAQSCLENGYAIPSYWDNPQISALIRYNNMVGLKSQLLNSSWYDKSVWPGKSIVKKTPEEYGGVPTIITDSFRVYDSIEQSFEDYLLFMKYASNYGYGGEPKYGEKILSMKNPEKLIKAVSKRGYATGSTYPTSVMKIINKHNLTKYDK